jgi:tRNA pseudouridine55 synthase
VTDLIINLNKSPGITSHRAVAEVKRLLGVKKAGHTGTLDPMATGVLLICLNEATKVSRFLLDMDKRYHARVKLGERTDTYDSQGRVIEQKDASTITEEDVVRAVKMFEGSMTQKPPMYSAVKVQGKKLYEFARQGIEIERQERRVHIYEIQVSGFDLPYFDLAISCSKGTYIRTLCDDIGALLGTGAHLFSLERSAIGPFDIKNSAKREEVGRNDFFEIKKKSVCSIDEAISGLREIVLNEADYRGARSGVPIKSNIIKGLADCNFVKLKGPCGELFGIGRIDSDCIRIERIINI